MGFEGWNLDVLSRTGGWLIFGIILLPLYGMLLGWFLGKPRQLRLSLMGVGILLGITVAVWVGLHVFVTLLGLIFF